MASSSAGSRFAQARDAIFHAHDQDPNTTTVEGEQVPYESHYARKMEHYLSLRSPAASDILRLAVCAQHFRRWEVPRSDYPMTKLGYHTWRSHLKKRQANLVGAIVAAHYPPQDAERCEALIAKEELGRGEEEVQVLEDVACLVFLDDQFDDFQTKHDEEKIVGILRKTWGKMSSKGQDMALEIPMTDECKALVQKALQ